MWSWWIGVRSNDSKRLKIRIIRLFINGQMIMIKTHVIHIREISAQMMERVLFVEM